jgi:RNA polymerase sigma-70 factor (ECF subfamily)
MTRYLDVTSRASPAIGDEAAGFAQLYEAHVRAVYNYCLYRVGDPAVAEDLTADAFERAWRARRRYNPRRAQFSTWLFTIVRRLVIDWQRRQARRPVTGLHEQLASPQRGPDARLAEIEERRRLQALIRSLPPHHQELVAFKFGAGLTNREIAKLLGKSETAIGSAIYRIVRRLREQWEEDR